MDTKSCSGSDDSDIEEDHEDQLGQWLGQLETLKLDLDSGQGDHLPQPTKPMLTPKSDSLDTFRFSMINLEDGGDADLDALLGELCHLESQLSTAQRDIKDSLAKQGPSPGAGTKGTKGMDFEQLFDTTSADLAELDAHIQQLGGATKPDHLQVGPSASASVSHSDSGVDLDPAKSGVTPSPHDGARYRSNSQSQSLSGNEELDVWELQSDCDTLKRRKHNSTSGSIDSHHSTLSASSPGTVSCPVPATSPSAASQHSTISAPGTLCSGIDVGANKQHRASGTSGEDSVFSENLVSTSDSSMSLDNKTVGAAKYSSTETLTEEHAILRARIASLQEDMEKENVPRAEQAARMKTEKIKIALEKIKEASVKKLFVQAHCTDGSSKTILVDEKMTIGHVVSMLVVKNHCKPNFNWSVVEHMPDLFMDRLLEDHDYIVENLMTWSRDTTNKLMFVERRDKYDLFRHPEDFLLVGTAQAQSSSLDERGRKTLIREFLSDTSGTKVPNLEGMLYIKAEGKKVWRKHFCILRASGIYCNPKGKGKSSKDLVCLCQFEYVELYTGFGWKKKYKAPTDFGFALKHPQIQKKSKYIKYFCTEDPEAMHQWMTGIRIAKFGKQLLVDYETTRSSISHWTETVSHLLPGGLDPEKVSQRSSTVSPRLSMDSGMETASHRGSVQSRASQVQTEANLQRETSQIHPDGSTSQGIPHIQDNSMQREIPMIKPVQLQNGQAKLPVTTEVTKYLSQVVGSAAGQSDMPQQSHQHAIQSHASQTQSFPQHSMPKQQQDSLASPQPDLPEPPTPDLPPPPAEFHLPCPAGSISMSSIDDLPPPPPPPEHQAVQSELQGHQNLPRHSAHQTRQSYDYGKPHSSASSHSRSSHGSHISRHPQGDSEKKSQPVSPRSSHGANVCAVQPMVIPKQSATPKAPVAGGPKIPPPTLPKKKPGHTVEAIIHNTPPQVKPKPGSHLPETKPKPPPTAPKRVDDGRGHAHVHAQHSNQSQGYSQGQGHIVKDNVHGGIGYASHHKHGGHVSHHEHGGHISHHEHGLVSHHGGHVSHHHEHGGHVSHHHGQIHKESAIRPNVPAPFLADLKNVLSRTSSHGAAAGAPHKMQMETYDNVDMDLPPPPPELLEGVSQHGSEKKRPPPPPKRSEQTKLT